MKTSELNRDIKRLSKDWTKAKELSNDEYFELVENILKPELRSLYYADRKFKYLNKKSILIMLSLNLSHRVIPFHRFGMNIEIK